MKVMVWWCRCGIENSCGGALFSIFLLSPMFSFSELLSNNNANIIKPVSIIKFICMFFSNYRLFYNILLLAYIRRAELSILSQFKYSYSSITDVCSTIRCFESFCYKLHFIVNETLMNFRIHASFHLSFC